MHRPLRPTADRRSPSRTENRFELLGGERSGGLTETRDMLDRPATRAAKQDPGDCHGHCVIATRRRTPN